MEVCPVEEPEGNCFFNTVVSKNLTKVTFEQIPRGSKGLSTLISGRDSIPGAGNSQG